MSFLARMLIGTVGLALALPACGPTQAASPAERSVYLARDLPDEELIVLGATLAAFREDSVLLLDSTKASPYLKSFLTTFKPEQVVSISEDSSGSAELENRLNIKTVSPITWSQGPPLALWRSLFTRTEDVVVCPAHPRSTLLEAACLAGALKAPLYVVHGRIGERKELSRRLKEWSARRVHLIGKAEKVAADLPNVEHVILSGENAVAAAYQKQLSRRGRIELVVVANPADTRDELGATSALAPWIAVRKRAALLLTNSEGTNVGEVMDRALRRESLRQVDSMLIVANLKAIPMWQRPNPIAGDKDPHIEMEPLTPSGHRPFTFATGRLFHADRAIVPLMLARQRLIVEASVPRKALVASNSGGGLSLLETFSRNTIEALRNAGYQTTTLIGSQVSRDEVRKLLPRHDLFLWEGHSGTLMNDYEFPTWDEPLPATFVFLQSCLALTEARASSVLSRGAVAVVGSSTRTYSGSGGACSLSFFNALLYEDRPVGEALRQAKNFLLAYSLLKEKRLGKGATHTGANIRSAWAFTLWGDPTLKLPPPRGEVSGAPQTPFVRHQVQGNTIIVSLPGATKNVVRTEKYQTTLPPNGRAAGLVRKERIEERRPLVPFVFAEVKLPKGRTGQTPRLSSRLPSSRWVLVWDERRRIGYLLAMPRPQDTEELRFQVRWETVEAVKDKLSTVSGAQ